MKMNQSFLEKYAAGDCIPRHRHGEAYIAVVLAGTYIEAGDQGRVKVEAGDVIVHDAFEAHLNEFGANGGLVLNLPPVRGLAPGTKRIEDLDLVARLAEQDPISAGLAVLEGAKTVVRTLSEWPDHIAKVIEREPAASVMSLADELGFAPQSVSRGFRRAFGVSPKRYRADQRALRTVKLLTEGTCDLANLASKCGFSDQAHMSREVRQLTGLSPRELRVHSVQDKVG
jgi:AraC-like DNA-binding protein